LLFVRCEMKLPGLSEQINFLRDRFEPEGKSILIFGTNSEEAANAFLQEGAERVEIIVEEYDNFLRYKFSLGENSSIPVKIMEFTVTDYSSESFDLIYAQASVSSARRNKIYREIKRIVKPSGIFCVGEFVKFTDELPPFVANVLDNSDIVPLKDSEAKKYFIDRNWEVLAVKDVSFTLEKYYAEVKKELEMMKKKLTDEEKIWHKKLLNKISHESNVFLKLGGSRYIGFKVFILRKEGKKI